MDVTDVGSVRYRLLKRVERGKLGGAAKAELLAAASTKSSTRAISNTIIYHTFSYSPQIIYIIAHYETQHQSSPLPYHGRLASPHRRMFNIPRTPARNETRN